MKVVSSRVVERTSEVWSPRNIELIEKTYDAEFVMDTCLRGRDGSWLNFPAAIFYTKKAHPEGSNYFAMYVDENDRACIANGISAVDKPIDALLVDDRVVYSRYRHDYRCEHGVFIDGGRDYGRMGGDRFHESKQVYLRVDGPDVIVEEVPSVET